MLLNRKIRTAVLHRCDQGSEVLAKALQHVRWNLCGGLTGVDLMGQVGGLFRNGEVAT